MDARPKSQPPPCRSFQAGNLFRIDSSQSFSCGLSDRSRSSSRRFSYSSSVMATDRSARRAAALVKVLRKNRVDRVRVERVGDFRTQELLRLGLLCGATHCTGAPDATELC